MMDKINSLNQKYSRAREEDKGYDFITGVNMTKETMKTGIDQTVITRISFSSRIQCEQDYREKPRYEQNYRNDSRRGNIRGNLRTNQIFRGQNYKGGYRENYRNGRGRSRSRERQYQGNIRRNDRSSSSRSRSGSRPSINRDRIRCYMCRQYDHFTKDCLMTKIEKEKDQIQQVLNMDEDQTALKALVTDTYDSLNQVGS